MSKIKYLMGGLIAALLLCLLFINVNAAEVGEYTYLNQETQEVLTIEIIDEEQCVVPITINGVERKNIYNYIELTNGHIYIPTLKAEFEIGVSNTLILVEGEDKTQFELNEETIDKILDLVGKFSNGEYSEAFNELKVAVGVAGAVVIIAVLIGILLIIKYFKMSAAYKNITAKLTEIQAKQFNEAIDGFEKKVNAILDEKIKQMEMSDEKKQAQVNEMVKAIDTKLANIK